jgi:hypothetical protein
MYRHAHKTLLAAMHLNPTAITKRSVGTSSECFSNAFVLIVSYLIVLDSHAHLLAERLKRIYSAKHYMYNPTDLNHTE